MSYLVTSCNAGSGSALLFRFRSGEGFSPIILPLPGDVKIKGLTGIDHFGDGYLIGVQSREFTLLYLDRTMKNARFLAPEEIKDAHGVRIVGDRAFIAATATNRVIELGTDLSFKAIVGASSEHRVDCDHVNDLGWYQGRLVASRFGPHRNSGVRIGAIFDVVTGDIIADGFSEPHSVTVHDDVLYVLESRTGMLFRHVLGLGPIRLLSVHGYARGLLVEEDRILVGRSRLRAVSRSTSFAVDATISADEDEARLTARAGMYEIFSDGRNVFWELPKSASEVYGICVEKAA